VRVNGYSLRVESVRENRVQAVRIRDHEQRERQRGNGAAVRPVEDAAGTARGPGDADDAGASGGGPPEPPQSG
jgi:hypothetical protein